MSDLKLFRISADKVDELKGQSVAVEKSLQTLIEKHLNAFLGVRFLASEYSTGKTHSGRIDTLGIDENCCPVIIEYKRALNENVINQGLFYLDWLLDHKAEFKLLTIEKFGQETANSIEWASPRLLCIAGDFTKYDEHAVQQINRNIDLIRYKRYGDEMLLLELVNATTAITPVVITEPIDETPPVKIVSYVTVAEYLNKALTELRDRFELLKAYLLAMGDDVSMKELKFYFAFKRLRNIACVEVHPSINRLTVYVTLNPDTVELRKGFTRDVRKIGHYGTGDLEIAINSDEDLEMAKPYLIRSYEEN